MRYRHHNENEEQVNVDMTPLIDVVFILLIFFVLSASFQKTNQINVERPQSQVTDEISSVSIMVSVDKQDQIWIDNQAIDISALGARVKQKSAQANNVSVVVNVDRSVESGRLIQVIDKIRIAGVNNVAVATES